MSGEPNAAEQWLRAEYEGCFDERVERLEWLASRAPQRQHWLFFGGWLNQQLFEQARYCFVYGQFLGTVMLGFAYVERTLAAMFYVSGRDRLAKHGKSQEVIQEALKAGWITEDEFAVYEKARSFRNSLTHFRIPLHEELPESRAFREGSEPHDVVEDDARRILEAVFPLVERNAAG
jgi:uncharacterized membrane protein